MYRKNFLLIQILYKTLFHMHLLNKYSINIWILKGIWEWRQQTPGNIKHFISQSVTRMIVIHLPEKVILLKYSKRSASVNYNIIYFYLPPQNFTSQGLVLVSHIENFH